MLRTGSHGDLDDGFLRAAGEQVDQVDGVAGGDYADEVAGECDVVGACFLPNQVEGAEDDALGFFNAGTGWGSEAEADQRDVGIREDFGTEFREQNHDAAACHHQVDQHQRPAEAESHPEIAFVGGPQPAFCSLFVARTHQPGGEDRHQRAGENKRSHHGKSDSQSEGHKQLTPDAHHKERGHEDCQHTQHRKQTGGGGPAAGFQNRCDSGNTRHHAGVDVLNLDGSFIHQNTDREGETAQRHNVEGLAGGPEGNHSSQEGERDVQDNDQGSAPVPQEEEDHEAGEGGTEQAFVDQAPNSVAHVGGLVEFQPDIDIRG